MPTPDVLPATRADVPDLSAALARAFFDDPVMAFLFPDERRRPADLRVFFSMELRVLHLAHGGVFRGAGMEGGALWAPPGHWKMTTTQLIRAAPPLLRIFRQRVGVALGALSMVEKAHPSEAHWYLAILGTDTVHQGHGWGGRLLAPVLTRCDADGTPAYLESSKESNIAFYARHGFEVTERVDLTPKGPPVWGMWREPRPPDRGAIDPWPAHGPR